MRIQRIEDIERYVLDNGSVKLDTLCDIFEISKNTLRRDINEIIKNGTIKKVYGGVASTTQKKLTPYEERTDKNEIKKLEIALKAAELVEDNDIIYVDSGTTTCHMGLGLKDKKVTVITNNLSFIEGALPYSNIEVVLLPGSLNRETKSFIGIDAERMLEKYNINKAFLATTGITLNNKVTNSSPEESKIKSIAVKNSEKNYVLMDDTKYNSMGLMTYTTLRDIDYIVTNTLDSEFKEQFDELNIKVYLTK